MNWEEIWKIVLEFLTTTGIKLVVAALIVIVGFWIVKKLVKLLTKAKFYQSLDPSAGRFIFGFVKIALQVVIALTAVAYLGIPMTNIIAVLGSCGLAIGLALQGSLSNFAGGLLLLIFKPFKTGDYIEASGVGGTVRDVTILYTHLTTPDNRHVVIPNGELSNEPIVNYSAEDTRRMDISIGASYNASPALVRSTLLELARADERVLDTPAAVVNVASYGDSAINYTLRLWVKSEHYWDVYNDINNAIKDKLDSKGIEIPFPQIDVHIDK